jgi:outer membrane protein OmpA-like peptidoglycan-associated protein
MRNCLLWILLFVGVQASAQEKMEVIRSNAIPWQTRVSNIYVSEDNQVWAASDRGVFRVFDANLGEPVRIPAGEQSLLRFRSGNAELNWDEQQVQDILGQGVQITAAIFDNRRDELWIGTSDIGLLRLKTKPSLKLVEHLTTANSKLRSNQINTFYLDARGRLWVGTEQGALVGEGGRWKLLEKDFNILAISGKGLEIWMMGDGLVGRVDARDNWLPIDIPARKTEGNLSDITFDDEGKLWIASEIITRYDPETKIFDLYGPAQNYTSQFASCLFADRDGSVWIGTRDKGLYVIRKASTIALNILVKSEVSCSGNGKDGALQVLVSGGQPPYDYRWEKGLAGTNPTGLEAGLYRLTVTDSKGGEKVGQIEITDFRMQLSAVQTREASSPGASDGQAKVEVQGEIPPFSYKWDNGESSAAATQLSEGLHQVTVSSPDGCSSVATVNISRALAELAVNINLAQAIKCPGGTDAALQAEATGGKAPYQYKWSAPGLSGSQAQGLAAGEYQLTVTDAAGQQQSASIRIAEPAALAAEASATSPASTGNANGQARASATGGTPPYSYAWDNGQRAAEASGLAPGTRSVTVTDAAGCTATASVDITEDILPLTLRLSQSAPVACQGGSSAALAAELSGGKAPFQFKWSAPGLSGSQAQGLAAGEYQLTVTDAAGQQQSASIRIAEPAALAAEASATSPASTGNANGQARASATGGTPPYSYAWDNGQRAAEASGLAPGTRSVTVTDAAGCTATASVAISEDILPLALRLSQSAEVACQGGKEAAIAAEVTGGKGPFQYKWSQAGLSGAQAQGLSAGQYSLTVTDASGQEQAASIAIAEPAKLAAEAVATAPASTGNADGQARASATGGTSPYAYAWDDGQRAAEASGLAPGTRSVTITDAAGCTATASVAISEDILPLALRLSQSAEVACQGGKEAAIAAGVTGGKGPFQYKWSQAGLSGAQAQGLSAGQYSLTVTDASGQEQAASIAIAEPAKLAAEAVATAPASTGNADGQARASATGGTSPYAYAWDDGQRAAEASGLAPGTQSVTVTDANGCVAIASVEITENILPLTASLKLLKEITCADAADATLSLEINGGKGPFQFQWNVEGITGQQADRLGPGDYQVTVTDVLGTTKIARLAIAEPAPLTAAITGTQPAFSETTKDGKAAARAQGGREPYAFQWSNGAVGPEAEGFQVGKHQLTVSDSKGCQVEVDFEITERIMKELAGGALRSGQTIQMQKLQFDADSTNLRDDALPILDEIYVFLQDNPTIAVEIGGHTNNLPPAEYCDMLSTARARAVAEHLVQKGIDPERVFYVGYGKRNPLFSNATEDGRRRNQRVEIKILRL